MLSKLIEFSLTNRFLVITLTVLMGIAGVSAALQLPIDAVPDMTNVQVQVITDAGSLSPVEAERYVTYPVEWAMAGLPNVEEVRSVSKFGISSVTIVFEEGTDIYWARQIVSERLTTVAADIPEGYGTPELGPTTTALGEILQFEVRGDNYSTMDLRTILEWEISPRLREVAGVTEVNSQGGYYKTFEVRPNPDRLASHGLALSDLIESIEQNNGIAGGGYVVHFDEQRFIRGQALLKEIADIENIVLRRAADGTPTLVRDVAQVAVAPMTRQGAVTRDGRGEAVVGMAMMLIGENSREVVEAVKVRLEEIRPSLPEGVDVEVIYDRAGLIERTLETVLHNLAEGGALVIIVLLVMLGSFRAGLIVALAIPLAMLFATNMMMAAGISASLMSLGAIDFGLIVDSSVIMVENCVSRLAGSAEHSADGTIPDSATRLKIVHDAAIEVRKPTMFGELIIMVVYVPILMLEGVEGKLFGPMATTVLFALFGSMVLSLTFMPAMASLALPRNISEKDVWLVRLLKKGYRPLVNWTVHQPLMSLAIAIGTLGVSIPVAWSLGAEFMPRLEEGDLLVEVTRLPSASLEGAVELGAQVEQALLEFPEVKTVFCKTGRPEIANDIMGVHQTDVWVMLHPRDQWKETRTRDDLIEDMSKVLDERVAGISIGFSQPIEMRVDELVAGVKADVAVLLYGDDLKVLADKSREIERVLRDIPGAVDVKAAYQANLSTRRTRPLRRRRRGRPGRCGIAGRPARRAGV